MIRKSVKRFFEKIMLNQESKAMRDAGAIRQIDQIAAALTPTLFL
jgi:uncharacterized protein (UPF0147 family)